MTLRRFPSGSHHHYNEVRPPIPAVQMLHDIAMLK